jgi:CRP-like cAMP-binding protein
MPIENEALQGLPLFASLSTTELEEVSTQLDVTTAEPKAELMREGDSGGHPLFILLSGAVDVVKRGMDGRGHVIASLAAPSVFGEIELLGRRRASASVVATSRVRVAQLRRGIFDEMCNAGRPAALKIIRNLAQVLSYRLAATDDQLAAQFDLAVPGVKEKVEELRRVIYSTWQPPVSA